MTEGTDHLLDLVRTRTADLLDALAVLDDRDVREPSRLPAWTRAHLLTHVARSGDAMLNAFHAAVSGEPTPMYPSREARSADIEAGADRTAAELVRDVAESGRRWQEAAGAVPESAWGNLWQHPSGPRDLPATAIPLLRLGEVELHWYDLGVPEAPNPPAAWPGRWVARMLDDATFGLDARAGQPLGLRCSDTGWSRGPDQAGRTIVGTQADLLAWVTGRSPGTDLVAEPRGDVPELGPWR